MESKQQEISAEPAFAELSREEEHWMGEILNRAEIMGVYTDNVTPLSLRMDLEAVHYHTPLDFKKMAQADEVNFAHDISGIIRAVDRNTGLLRDYFKPRFAVHQ